MTCLTFLAGVTFVFIFSLGVRVSYADDRKPIWAIYHVSNDEAAVADGLKLGANGFETDLQFDKVTGIPTIVTHTSPCFRDGYTCKEDDYCVKQAPVVSHLQHLRDISNKDDPKFSGFVWLDLKLYDNPTAEFLALVGTKLADMMVNEIFITKDHGSRLKFGMEIYSASSIPVMVAVADQLKTLEREDILKRIVVIDELKNRPQAGDERLDKITGFWAASGCSDCNNECGRDLDKARSAASLKGQGVDKVVRWTIDIEDHIREGLRAGVDAFCTNHPEVVKSILEEDEFKGLRLANAEDKICQNCED